MKKLLLFIFACYIFTGCNNQNVELTRFRNEIDDFCNNILVIDSDINAITIPSTDEAGLKQATSELIYNLDILKDEFVKFSNIDFPSEYDYLEPVADEASDYMTEAVNSYHKVYEENYTASMEEYALENYSRAYKRVQVIFDVLQNK